MSEPQHDEALATTTLDGSRLTTLRSWVGYSGTYFYQARLKSSPTSDFRLWPHRRVMDRACRIVYEQQVAFTGANPRTNTNASIPAGQPGAPGTLFAGDAVGYEAPVKRALRAALTQPVNADGNPGHVSGLSYALDLTADIASTKAFKSNVKIVPLAYIDDVETTLSYAFSL